MYKLWIKYLLLVFKFDSTFLIKLTPHPPMSTVINKKSRCYKVHHSKTQSSEKREMYLLNLAQTDETHLLIVYIFSQWSETERSEPHDDQSLLEQESSETVFTGWAECTVNILYSQHTVTGPSQQWERSRNSVKSCYHCTTWCNDTSPGHCHHADWVWSECW